MKKRIMIWVSCLALILSGCGLFPLRSGEQPLVRGGSSTQNEVGEVNPNQNVGEGLEPPVEATEDVDEDLALPVEAQTVKPAEIDESEEVIKDLVYCISPVNIREEPNNTSRVIGSLRTGDAMTMIRQDAGWVEITFEGMHGYVYMDYISEALPN